MGLKTKYDKIKRSEKIINVFMKSGFGYLIDQSKLNLGSKIKKYAKSSSSKSLPERMRCSLEELGPTFIKLGQVLSTRPDFLPKEFIVELEKLQDEVPPFDQSVVFEFIDQELGKPVDQLFKQFQAEPVASASLSQVHKAILPNGSVVAVKVQRPQAKELVELDLEILKDLMGFVDRRLSDNWVYRPSLMVKEFSKSILKEIDFANEGRNYEKFQKNFKDTHYIKIPKIHWDLTTSKILTMEFVKGIKINEIAKPEHQENFDSKLVAKQSADITLKQIFEDGFFHGDPHPANVFVRPPATIVMLDVGRVGYVDKKTAKIGANLLMAMVNKNIDEVVDCLRELDMLENETNLTVLRQDITELIENYLDIPLKDLNTREFFKEFLEVLGRHNLVLPSNFALMIHSFALAETTARKLDPNFNMVSASKPFLKKMTYKQFSSEELLKKGNVLIKDGMALMEKLPKGLSGAIDRIASGTIKFDLDYKDINRITSGLIRMGKIISLSMIFASLFVGSSLIMLRETGPMLAGYPLLGVIGYIAAFIIGLITIIMLWPRKRE